MDQVLEADVSEHQENVTKREDSVLSGLTSDGSEAPYRIKSVKADSTRKLSKADATQVGCTNLGCLSLPILLGEEVGRSVPYEAVTCMTCTGCQDPISRSLCRQPVLQ